MPNNFICPNCHSTIKKASCYSSCCICSSYIHNHCIIDCSDSNSVMCISCSGNVQLPFNHIVSDFKFYDAIDLGNSVTNDHIDIDLNEKFEHLCFNPVSFDQDCHFPSDTNLVCRYYNQWQYNSIEDSNDMFSIFHINIDSLNCHFDDLQDLLNELKNDFSIVGISETYLKDVPSNLLVMSGYKLEYKNRLDKRKGGVAMYIKDNINFTVRHDLNIFANSSCESLFIEIARADAKNIIVGILYRPPGNNNPIKDFNTDFENLLSTVNGENKICYLMGDFNIDLLKYDVHLPTKEFVDLMYSYSFYPTINKPTRITRTSATCIDNIITNNTYVTKSGILTFDVSDHLPVFVKSNHCFERPVPKVTQVYRREETDDNINILNKRLSLVNWNDVLGTSTNNADVLYDRFLSKFMSIYNDCIPLTKCNQKGKKKCGRSPWITSGILKSINTKNKLYVSYLKHPTEINLVKFNSYRNKLKSLIRKSKRDYYADLLSKHKNNARDTWKTLNHILKKKRGNNVCKKFRINDDDVLTDSTGIANSFNDYFVNIGPKLANSLHDCKVDYSDFLKNGVDKSMFLMPVNDEEVYSIVQKLDSKKSAGHDGVGARIVKKTICNIVTPLVSIFNTSFLTGTVPNNLKIAKVIPIFKKDNPELFSNYRPVSVLTIISKILERLVFNRCIKFINDNNILHNRQFGFRPNHSTYMAVIDLINNITNAVENDCYTVGVFLDLSKAFDTINHDILIDKLNYLGFRGIVNDWFRDYLSNRKQYVCYDSTISSLKPITCGVPQGSILGPLLFILYINDLPSSSSKLDFVVYADDTNLFYSHKDIHRVEEVFNEELTHVCNWFNANKLSVNAKKTNFMLMGTAKNTHSAIVIDVKLNGSSLTRVTNTVFLGMHIDENITWKCHIDHIISVCSRNVGVINKLKNFLPEDALYSLYCTLILPYLNYGIMAWGSACVTYLSKLYRVQKKSLRIISNSYYRAETHPLLLRFNTLNVFDMYKLELGSFMFKYTNNLLPPVFNHAFTKHSQVHSYNTRYKDNLTIPKVRKGFSNKNVYYSGPLLWNNINPLIKYSTNVRSFRVAYKNYLLSHYH